MISARSGYWILLTLILTGCGGGGSGASQLGEAPASGGCSGDCAADGDFLTIADVETIIAQAVNEADSLEVDSATIAVVDRVGNVLGVFRLASAVPQQVVIATALDAAGNAVIDGGLEGIRFPISPVPVVIDDQAAISKAVTGAYLSSEGNAFSTRTANQIVQANFNPGELNQPSGPLFGVQFSQFACSDFIGSFNGIAASVGPQRSPFGLSADPGGFPVYKNGTAVGGVGVVSDGQYGVDAVISDQDRAADELIALAATFGYAAPVDRRADQITVEGKTLRFSDVSFEDLSSDPASAPPFATIDGAVGSLTAVNGYSAGNIVPGTAFGTAASGIRSDGNVNYPGQDAFVFVDDANSLRYPPRNATDGSALGPAALSVDEVRTIVDAALNVANRARAQIRRPLGSTARVTVSVVDTNGEILAMARNRDAPVFGADVSLQKARTATFFSSAAAADFLRSLPNAIYLETSDSNFGVSREIVLGDYVDDVQAFLEIPTALEDGAVAFSDRAGGNLSRPFFPDGLQGRENGPFSKPAGEWSPFTTGLQLDLSLNALLTHVFFVAGAFPDDVEANCAGVELNLATGGNSTISGINVANGLQIFPGSVPIYRGDTLVGGIGVSGDGIDQDDMIAFLGLHEAGLQLASGVANAPVNIRADTLQPKGVRLRYVQCPQSPYVDSNAQMVCDGL